MKLTAAMVIACAAIAGMAAPHALAQERALRVGMLDIVKIQDQFKEFQQATAQFNAFARERQAEVIERAGLRLLNADELKEYQNLKAVVAPSEEQKLRIEQIRAVAETRENELKMLQTAANPTDEQKKRLAELDNLAQASQPEIDALRERVGKEIDDRRGELSERLRQKIDSAAAAVMKEKRIDLVLDKQIVFGGVDVTGDVLAKLNAGS